MSKPKIWGKLGKSAPIIIGGPSSTVLPKITCHGCTNAWK